MDRDTKEMILTFLSVAGMTFTLWMVMVIGG
jgi:hypothetical protein